MSSSSPLADRLKNVRERIAQAAHKAHRDPAEIMLVAVTKNAAPEQVREILSLGVTDLGESRVPNLIQRAGQFQEFLTRRAGVGGAASSALTPPHKIRWHMMGHLQRNKVKPLLPMVSIIHSLDSLRLAEEIEAHSAKLERRIPVLLQINAAEESQKFGVAVGAAIHLAEQIDTMPKLQLYGVMTMGPLNQPPAVVQAVFARVREIFEEMRWHKIGGSSLRHLSMGMSDDFELAIAEGATMVRVGSALFGGAGLDHDQEASA